MDSQPLVHLTRWLSFLVTSLSSHSIFSLPITSQSTSKHFHCSSYRDRLFYNLTVSILYWRTLSPRSCWHTKSKLHHWFAVWADQDYASEYNKLREIDTKMRTRWIDVHQQPCARGGHSTSKIISLVLSWSSLSIIRVISDFSDLLSFSFLVLEVWSLCITKIIVHQSRKSRRMLWHIHSSMYRSMANSRIELQPFHHYVTHLKCVRWYYALQLSYCIS